MKKILALTLIILLTLNTTHKVNAQCAMCRASATSSMNNKDKSNNAKHIGAGLNTGILYLMCILYIIGGVGTFFYWRNKKAIKAFLNGEAA